MIDTPARPAGSVDAIAAFGAPSNVCDRLLTVTVAGALSTVCSIVTLVLPLKLLSPQ